MTGHFTDADLERYLDGSLAPAALLDADDHVAVCPACRDRLAARRDPATATRALRGAATGDLHASDDEIQAYVAGTLGAPERARLDEHAAGCPTCARQLDELQAWVKKTPAPSLTASMMWKYALAAAAVFAVSITLGYWQAMRHAEPAGLRGLATLAPDVQSHVRAAIAAGEMALPADVAALAGSRETMMGGRTAAPFPSFYLLTPVATAVIQDRPTLAWEPLPEADGYDVAVFDDLGRPVGRPLDVRGPAVVLVDPLPRGRVYTWQVTARRGTERVTVPAAPEPPAKFKVLERAAADALLDVERAHPDSHLLLGVLALRAGVLEDARRHLRAVPADDPQAALARRTLARIAPPVNRSAAP